MVRAGDGYRFHVTGLTHDERGYPSMNVETQDRSVRRLLDKLKPLAGERALYRNRGPGRRRGGGGFLRHHLARGAAGHPAGARPGNPRRQVPPDHGVAVPAKRKSASWPGRVKAFVVPELNLGQMVHRSGARRRGPGQGDFRSRTRAAPCITPRPFSKPLWRRPDERSDAGNPLRNPGGRAQPGRAVPAHGPHAAHLVPGMRHRHHGQLLHARAARFQGQPGQGRGGLRHRLHRPRGRVRAASIRSTPRTAAPFPSPPG